MASAGPSRRPRPRRLERLPEQYFGALVGRVAAAAGDGGAPIVDLGRGNPEVGPPEHVVRALAEAAAAPSRSRLRARSAAYPRSDARSPPAIRTHYGVELDPDREVAIVPGTKTAILELALALAESGDRILLPDPYYPDYPSGIAPRRRRPRARAPRSVRRLAARLRVGTSRRRALSQLPFESVRRLCRARHLRGRRSSMALRTGTAVIHDAAYADLVFDGRKPVSFLATPGAKEVGVELWSMSKTYGMAGWRIGFVLGNAEIVERINLAQNDHVRRSESSARSSAPRLPPWKGHRRASSSAAPPTSAGATGSRPCFPSRPSARARSSSG